ncbi:MAG: GNAT family N-acetyltransferase [Planctomycetes bacterium]|nr:GNAT family N-acetyltransferase [Planctomycetota bacterium]
MSDNTPRRRIDVNSRVHLSEIRASDKAAFVRHLSDGDICHYTFRIPFPYSESDAEQWIRFVAGITEDYGEPTKFAIRDPDEYLIGSLGFDGLTKGHSAEIGYWLAKPYWGHGLMTDVLRAACTFAFDQWNLVRITAYVFPFNKASQRVLEKNGFQFEGLLRKHHKKGKEFLDAKLYALVP